MKPNHVRPVKAGGAKRPPHIDQLRRPRPARPNRRDPLITPPRPGGGFRRLGGVVKLGRKHA